MISCSNENNKIDNVPTINGNKNKLPKEDFGNRNLYVKGLWKNCTQIELDDLFKQYGSIAQSRVYGNGVGFIRFQEPEQARAAIFGLNGKEPSIKCQQPLFVKYANKKIRQPKANDQSAEMFVCENTKNIYIRFLPSKYNESELYQLCSKFGQITCIRLCKKGFAFVRFLTPKSASLCIEELNGKLLPESSKALMVKFANSDPFEPRIGFHSPYLPQYYRQHSNINFHTGLQNNHSNPLSFGGQEINNNNNNNNNANFFNLKNDASSNVAFPTRPLLRPNNSDIYNSSISSNLSTGNEWNSPLALGNNISNTSSMSDISQVSSVSSSSSMWSLTSPYSYCPIPLNTYNYSNPQPIPLYSNLLNVTHVQQQQQQPSSIIPFSGNNIFSIPTSTNAIGISNNGMIVSFQPIFDNTAIANFNLSSLHPETLENKTTPLILNDNTASIQIPFSSLSING